MRIFVLLGESGSGKDSVAKELIKQGLLSRLITTTTRQARSNETDGVDYNFISEEDFQVLIEKDQFVEYNIFKDWYYGLTKDAILNSNNQNLLVILNPSGFRRLSKYAKKYNYTVIPIYIFCDERKRLIRTLERNDDVDEVLRRTFTDREDFKDIVNLIQGSSGYMVRNESDLKVTLMEINEIIGDYIG